MNSKIKLKSGDELYMEYIHREEHLEIKPFQYVNEKKIYMDDGVYELENNNKMIIKDKYIYQIDKK